MDGPDEPEEAGRPAGVEAGHHPALVGLGQLDVPRPHQLGVGDVDQSVAQDVLAEQHLALAAFEAPEVDLRLGQHHPLLAQLRDPPDRQVDPPAPDLGDQPGHQGQVAAAQAHDDVVDLADLLVGAGVHVAAQKGGQVHDRNPSPAAGLAAFGTSVATLPRLSSIGPTREVWCADE